MARKVKACPVCGFPQLELLYYAWPHRVKHWKIKCRYCGKGTQLCITKMGAYHAWNKLTNVVSVANVREVKADGAETDPV